MIYIIISNVGLALMTLIVYGRYSRFRIISGAEIRDLKNKLSAEAESKKILEDQVAKVSKSDNEKINELLRRVDELTREKEGEIKIRLESEKKIEVALQKIEEIQKRTQDWRLIQDAIMKDSRDAMVRVGNDLFKKLNDSYKVEVETNRNLIGRLSKNIIDLFEKGKPAARIENSANLQAVGENEQVSQGVHDVHANDETAKKLISDLIATMKANGRLANRDYFTPGNFDPEKAKMLLCEIAYIGKERLYAFDFKGCHFLEDFENQKQHNPSLSDEALKQKLEKYISYLSNKKYLESILKPISASNAKFESSSIVFVVSSKKELQLLKEIHLYEKIRSANIEVTDLDGASNLVL